MTDELKVLGQSAPAATTTTVLYTVPNVTQTTVSSLMICNRGGAEQTYRVSVHVGDEATADKQYLFYDEALAATTTASHVLGLSLGEGDVVKVFASSADLSFNMFGVETS